MQTKQDITSILIRLAVILYISKVLIILITDNIPLNRHCS
jgi:hypothetical protein